MFGIKQNMQGRGPLSFFAKVRRIFFKLILILYAVSTSNSTHKERNIHHYIKEDIIERTYFSPKMFKNTRYNRDTLFTKDLVYHFHKTGYKHK
jgi:hypothetical protein